MASSQSTLSGIVELDLVVVDLIGADAREWLQGQVTQDLRTLEVGGSVRACLCKPTGQLLAHLEVWDLGDRLRLLIARSERAALLARVEEAVIMEDVEVQAFEARVEHRLGSAVQRESLDSSFVRSRSRTGQEGLDVIVLDGAAPNDPENRFDPELWNALTLAAGEPIPGVDTNEKTLPPELGPAFEAATTSYRKGCYTGQEILMRIHSRGHTNRTWKGVISPEPLRAGDRVLADGVEVGRVTRAGLHPTLGPIAGAYLRHEAEGKTITVETPNGATAVEVHDLPLLFV